MNTNSPQFSNSATHTTNKYSVSQPNAEVAWSTEKATLHHDGSHVVMPGPNKMAGKGKAGNVAKLLGVVKEANR